MKLVINILQFLINRFICRKSLGYCIKIFAEHMGIAYIKMAQILAMQNIGNIFTEDDRQNLLHICDECNPVDYETIESILYSEYGDDLYDLFTNICREPIGSASVSQVHKAYLKNGDVVAIKIKRVDIGKTIEHDIEVMRFIMNHFGKIAGLTNLAGGDYAMMFYLKWIKEEVDFIHEKENIRMYTKFAEEVNGNVPDTADIVLPKLYEDLCTDNVIVMEFIEHPTVSRMDNDPKTVERILNGFNDYIRLSFHALFTGKTIVWHGDPHAGNVYIDEKGNIGFLDMGLMFVLSPADADMTKEFFFSAYFGKYEKLYHMLLPYLKGNSLVRERFKEACELYCRQVRHKPITSYFMDMVWICLDFQIKPPDFLFGMAKAFICLGGVDIIYSNSTLGMDLVKDQVIQFLVDTAVKNGTKVCDQIFQCQKSIWKKDTVSLSKNISGIVKCLDEAVKYII